ncbi:glycosyltransferase family 4 protein [Flagellimonas iocasae]|uniref:Glycosyltransferase family 4 protein n=1 Tax=Flagellimonas iocasae TaxID=2055905 RepID=A0ABW4XYE9_9FLAO
MKGKLLQISNDFADQKIYVNLVRNLSEQGFHQIVYVPLKWKHKIDWNKDSTIENVEYFYSYILKRSLLFRLRYFNKINLVTRDVEEKIDLKKVSLVHAHFLFSDGGVAYKLKKKYGIPYVVSVRASDIFTFFGKMIHLRRFGNKIMEEAERVIFINHSYVHILEEKYLQKSFANAIKGKISIIPNAIDSKWFNVQLKQKERTSPFKLLYVGRIVKRKKLDIVLKAVEQLNNNSHSEYHLDVVGEGGFMLEAQKAPPENVKFHGKITSFDDLLKVYSQCHAFVMPSIKETFGLVYIESLSQGLPIIYCKNEGVDGYFEKGEVGMAVNPDSTKEIIEAVHHIELNYQELSKNAIAASRKFTWDESTEKYISIYKGAVH